MTSEVDMRPTQFLFPVLHVWIPGRADVILEGYAVGMLPLVVRAGHDASEELKRTDN